MANRYKVWQLLQSLCQNDSHPWLCIGDFNEVLQAHEQEGGNVRQHRQMEGFHNAVESCRFIHLGFTGNKYKWFTMKGGGIKVRLDRAPGNQEWIDLFPRFTVNHLNKSMSDHVPVLLDWSGHMPVRGRKQFRYEEFWNMHEGCAEVVRNGWENVVIRSPMFQVIEKIKLTRMQLNNWAQSNAMSGPR